MKNIDKCVIIQTAVIEFAKVFDLSAKPKTLSITIGWSRVVFSLKSSLSLKNSSAHKEVSSSLSFLLAILERTLKNSNRSSNCSIDFG